MIQAYFGAGKGKTTAAIGVAIRFLGSGGNVLFVQFLKNNDSSEFNCLKDIPDINFMCADERYELFDNRDNRRFSLFSDSYNKLLFEDVKGKLNCCKMLVLDEVLDALSLGYIGEDKLLEFLKSLCDTEVILTGHSISEKIKDICDYVSEIKEIKHPYSKGALPRKGIEF